ncbi:hypothetical protein, partial [Mycolicibacterium fortuitum]|uniref:hypothetical protein n=1 Tax=Mycolicibacterium fortuitum TaxID=1766 RepID=UPI001CE1483E
LTGGEFQRAHLGNFDEHDHASAGAAHTWIRSQSDAPALRADVTAAGWLWRRVDHGDRDAQVLTDVVGILAQRARRNMSRNTPGEPHVMLAVGPEVPWHLRELRLIAAVGRAHDVHLGVVAERLSSAGRFAHDRGFVDNIGGWYPGRPPLHDRSR